MSIAHAFQQHLKSIFTLSLLILLTACGGGGSSKDTKPDSFSFTTVTGVAVSTEVTSTAITVAGINKETAISISGGSYSINDGAFTTTAGTVTSGQTVKVKVTSSATTNTPVVATLTIGGVNGTFTATTAPDTTPDAFTFTAATGAALSSVNTSDTVTVSGFDTASISIVGGEYKIGSGSFVSTAGTISSGQTVTVRATAAATVSTAVNAVLTIGGVAGTYTVTTIADTVAPTAQIMFPPAVSLSNGTTLKVRGTAHDDYSSIASVTVNSVAAVSTDNYATWTADVPLTVGANTLTVVTTDNAVNPNTNSDAAHVTVQRAATLTSAHTPDANVPFMYTNFFVIDNANNRALITDNGLNSIIAMDLNTGTRTLLSSPTVPDTNSPFSNPQGIVLDTAHNRALVTDYNLKAIIAVNLTTGARTIFSDANTPNANNAFIKPYGIVLDADSTNNRNRALVADAETNTIVAVDLSTGARTVLSNATTPNTSIPFSVTQFGLFDITLDLIHNRILLPELNLKAVFAVDLTTGARTIISDNNTPTTANPFDLPMALDVDNTNNRALAIDFFPNSIISVDLISGSRTIISNSSIPNSNTPLVHPNDISFDSVKNIAFVVDSYPAAAISVVDIITGERVILSQ